jgi:hypothetical protein
MGTDVGTESSTMIKSFLLELVLFKLLYATDNIIYINHEYNLF